jgi:hypothetical protein
VIRIHVNRSSVEENCFVNVEREGIRGQFSGGNSEGNCSWRGGIMKSLRTSCEKQEVFANVFDIRKG